MNRENLREIINLVESTIGRRLNESSVPPFSNKREAMIAIQDVMDGSMTQKNFINQLASAKRSGTIDEKNFKLILGQLRMDAKSSGVELEQIIGRLIDKYHSGSDVFNPSLGESKKLTEDFFNQPTDQLFIYRRAAAKKSASGTPIYILRTNQGGYKLSRSYQIGNTIAGYYNGRVQNISESLNEAPLAPIAPVAAPSKPAAPAPVAAPVAPVEQGVDPSWKLDMIDFIGNSFQGQAKQFLYQAKKSNPKATPEQITAMVNDLIQSNQIVELFKTRFLSSIKAAL